MQRVLDYLRGLPLQAQVTLATAAGLALLLLFLVVSPLLGIWVDAAQRVESVEPRIARTLGFEESGELLTASLQQLQSQISLYTSDRSEDLAGLGAEMQQVTRKMAESAGLSVTGSQLLGAQEREWTWALRVNLELSGTAEALDSFLQELALAQPLMLVENLRIVPARQRRGEISEELQVSARVMTFRLREEV